MAREGGSYLIPATKKIVQQHLNTMMKMPLGGVLVEVFESLADPATFRIKPYNTGPNVYANPQQAGLTASVGISQPHGHVELEFWDGPVEEIPAPGWIHVFCGNFAAVSAGPTQTGVWASTRGHQITHSITIHVSKWPKVPSDCATWLINALHNLNAIATTRYAPVLEQPRRWQGADSK